MDSELKAIDERVHRLLALVTESTENDMQKLSAPARARDAEDLVADVEDLCSRIEDPNTLNLCTAIVFRSDGGVMLAVRQIKMIIKNDERKAFEKTKGKLMKFISLYTGRLFSTNLLVERHALDVKAFCIEVLKTDENSPVRTEALNPIRTVIKMKLDPAVLKVHELAVICLELLIIGGSKLTDKLRGNLFALTGFLCEYYPDLMRNINHPEYGTVTRVKSMWMNSLRKETSVGLNPKLAEMAGALEGLRGYMINFPTREWGYDNISDQRELFGYICTIIHSPATTYNVHRAALKLLYTHARQFRDSILEELNRFGWGRGGPISDSVRKGKNKGLGGGLYEDLKVWADHHNEDVRLPATAAINSYLREVSEVLATTNDESVGKRVFMALVESFRRVIRSDRASPVALSAAIRGYGYLALPCQRFLQASDVDVMLNDITQGIQHSLAQITNDNERSVANSVPSLLEAMASIIRASGSLSSLTATSVEKLLMLVFVSYPSLGQRRRVDVIHGVLRMLAAAFVYEGADVKVAERDSNIFKAGLQATPENRSRIAHVLTQGFFAGLQITVTLDTACGVGDEIRTDALSAHYELWSGILSTQTPIEFTPVVLQSRQRDKFYTLLYDAFVRGLLRLIQSLDVSTLPEDLDNDSMVNSNQPPTYPRDHQVLINVTALVSYVLSETEVERFPRWVYVYVRTIVVQVQQFPQVSCFYSLLSVAMANCERTNLLSLYAPKQAQPIPLTKRPIKQKRKHRITTTVDHKDELHDRATISTDGTDTDHSTEMEDNDEDIDERNDADEDDMDVKERFGADMGMGCSENDALAVRDIVTKFTRELVLRLNGYNGELHVACLRFIFSLPHQLYQDMLDTLVPAMARALHLGLGFVPLAADALATLDKWVERMQNNEIRRHFPVLLPLLEMYMKTSTDVGQVTAEEENERATLLRHQARTVNRKGGGVTTVTTASDLRWRATLLLGRIGSEHNMILLPDRLIPAYPNPGQRNKSEHLRWNPDDLLNYSVAFANMRVEIALDVLLPTVMELAESCSDRSTKVVACELFHALCLFLIGRSSQMTNDDPAKFRPLYERVLPAIFRLAVDIESVTRQLFNPLVHQIIHWFTTAPKRDSAETHSLLNTIVTMLGQPDSGIALRDLCALALREFLKWSIKHTDNTSIAKTSNQITNVKHTLKQLHRMMNHGDVSMRLGACLGVNQSYVVIREETVVVDEMILELFFNIIRCLRLSQADDPSLGTFQQANMAIKRMLRIVKKFANTLKKPNPRRRRPEQWIPQESSKYHINTVESEHKLVAEAIDLHWFVYEVLLMVGSAEQEARHTCMLIVNELSYTIVQGGTDIKGDPTSNENKAILKDKTRIYLRELYRQHGGGGWLVHIFERGLRRLLDPATDSFGGSTHERNLYNLDLEMELSDNLLATLDCYAWAFMDGYFDPAELLDSKFGSLLTLALTHFYSTGCLKSDLDTHVEVVEKKHLLLTERKARVVVRMFFLATIFIQRHVQWLTEASPALLGIIRLPKFISSIVQLVLSPSKLGFDVLDKTVLMGIQPVYTNFLRTVNFNAKTHVHLRMVRTAIIKETVVSIQSATDLNVFKMVSMATEKGVSTLDHARTIALINGYKALHSTGFLCDILEEMKEMESTDSLLLSVLKLPVGTPTQLTFASNMLDMALPMCDSPAILTRWLYEDVQDSDVPITKFEYMLPAFLVKNIKIYIDPLRLGCDNDLKSARQTLAAVIDYIYVHPLTALPYKDAFIRTLLVDLNRWPLWDLNVSWADRMSVVSLMTRIVDLAPLSFLASSENSALPLFVRLLQSVLEETDSPQHPDIAYKGAAFRTVALLEDIAQSHIKVENITNTTTDINELLRVSLEKMMLTWPVRGTDFDFGTWRYKDYISALDQLVSIACGTGSSLLFHCVLLAMCRDESHPYDDTLMEAMRTMGSNLAPTKAVQLLQLCMASFDHTQYPLVLRLGAMRKVCIPALQHAHRDTITSFYELYITRIVDGVSPPDKTKIPFKTAKYERDTQLRGICFQLIETLYACGDAAVHTPAADSSIVRSYPDAAKRGGKGGLYLTVMLIKAASAVQEESPSDFVGSNVSEESLSVFRQCRYHAYSALTTLLTRTQKPESNHFQKYLFNERVLDELIAPSGTTVIEFPVELDHFTRRVQLAKLKEARTTKENGQRFRPMTNTFDPSKLLTQSSQSYSASVLGINYTQSVKPMIDSQSQLLAVHEPGSLDAFGTFQVGTMTSQGMTTNQAIKEEEANTEHEAQLIASTELDSDTIELDALNKHECMPALLQVLQHLNPHRAKTENNTDKSGVTWWMRFLLSKVKRKPDEYEPRTNHMNVRMFMAKVVMNKPSIFVCCRAMWLPHLVQLVLDYAGEVKNGINSFIVDLCVLVIDWCINDTLPPPSANANVSVDIATSSAIPMVQPQLASSSLTAALKSRLITFLVENVVHESKSVMTNNLNLLKALLESWDGDLVDIPYHTVYQLLSTEGSSHSIIAGISVIGIVCTSGREAFHNTPQTEANNIDAESYFNALVGHINTTEKDKKSVIISTTAEVVGIILRSMESENSATSFYHALLGLLHQKLKELGSVPSSEPGFLKVLHKIAMVCPDVVTPYWSKLIGLFKSARGEYKRKIAEVFSLKVTEVPDLVNHIKPHIHSMIGQSDVFTRRAALKILCGLVPLYEKDKFEGEISWYIYDLTREMDINEDIECSTTYVGLLSQCFAELSNHQSGDIFETVRDELIKLLSHRSEHVRSLGTQFWYDVQGMPITCEQRIKFLFTNMYSPNVENHFIEHTVNMMLESCSRSIDFSEPLFDQPLSQCLFQKQRVSTDWVSRYQSSQSMFANTQMMNAEKSQTGFDSAYLRATQSMMFSQTQTQINRNQDGTIETRVDDQATLSQMFQPRRAVSTVSSVSPTQTQSNFEVPTTAPNGLKRMDVTNLKRRFLKSKDRMSASAHFAKTGALRNKNIEQVRQRHAQARANRVTLAREYRAGELPDIQIKHGEIIKSMKTLALKDPTIARQILVLLFVPLYRSNLQIDNEDTFKEVIKTMLSNSTKLHPPFIGCLLEVCLHNPSLSPDPAVVCDVGIRSGNCSLAAMVIEKLLSIAMDTAKNQSKRENERDDTREKMRQLWLNLAFVYRELGEFDVLSGLFSGDWAESRGQLARSDAVLGRAMRAEGMGDWREAQKQFIALLNTNNEEDSMDVDDITVYGTPNSTQTREFCLDGYIEASAHLTQWEEIVTIVAEYTNALQSPFEIDHARVLSTVRSRNTMHHYLNAFLKSNTVTLQADAKFGVTQPRWESMQASLMKNLVDTLSQSSQSGLRQQLEYHHNQHLALAMFMGEAYDHARLYCTRAISSFITQWNQLHPLVLGPRRELLARLQGLVEMDEALTFLSETTNFTQGTSHFKRLLRVWRTRSPGKADHHAGVWDDLMDRRILYMHDIVRRHRSTVDEIEDNILYNKEMRGMLKFQVEEEFKYYLQIAQAATVQMNAPVSSKFSSLASDVLTQDEDKLHERVIDASRSEILDFDRIQILMSQALSTLQTKASPNQLLRILPFIYQQKDQTAGLACAQRNAMNLMYRRCLWHLGYHLASTAQNSVFDWSRYGTQGATARGVISQMASDRSASTSNIFITGHRLEDDPIPVLLNTAYSGGWLSGTLDAEKQSIDQARILVEMATFGESLLAADGPFTSLNFKPNVSIATDIVRSVLQALTIGSDLTDDSNDPSIRAKAMLPYLLRLLTTTPSTMETFVHESESVPSWVFIELIPQMLPLLLKMESFAVGPILIRLARDYPHALAYPFTTSLDDVDLQNNMQQSNGDIYIEQLQNLLRHPVRTRMITELSALTNPEMLFQDWIEQDLKPIVDAPLNQKPDMCALAYARLMKLPFMQSSLGVSRCDGGSTIGPVHAMYRQKFATRVKGMVGNDETKLQNVSSLSEFSTIAKEIEVEARSNSKRPAVLLKEYSPWLAAFHSANHRSIDAIEIPGCYSGTSKPLPHHHPTITSFDDKVMVLQSIRKPKRIKIIANDGTTHVFLVKGGEDLRLDQRVESVFKAMNFIFKNDAECSKRRLNLTTYNVVPLSTRLGLIEWLQDCITTKQLLTETMSPKEFECYAKPTKDTQDRCPILHYRNWMAKNSPSQSKINHYHDALSLPRKGTVKMFREIQGMIPPDLLQRAVMRRVRGMESYLFIRNTFSRSLAVMCICQYILGIGDRHLSNSMFDTSNGTIVGIDFGHSLGSATIMLPVPELVPFRLTRQMTKFFHPHNINGLVRVAMITSMKALHAERNLILRIMDVFVNEPLAEWGSMARRQRNDDRLHSDVELSWYPRQKIAVVKKKLCFSHPKVVMAEELELNKNISNQTLNAALKVLSGDDRYDIRARIETSDTLTAEQHVDCLIDMATDANILGRTWEGWEPWM
eukprot:CFRG8139T1